MNSDDYFKKILKMVTPLHKKARANNESEEFWFALAALQDRAKETLLNAESFQKHMRKKR